MRKYYLPVFFLVILLLSACEQADDRPQITIWHQMLYAERLVLADVLEEYHRLNPDVKVTSLYRETEELRSGFQNSALAGSGPELVFGPSDQVGPFATMGIIRPLEDVLDSAYLGQFNPQALTWYNGHLFQIADRLGNHLTLVYNRSLVPVPPENSDDLIRLGQELTRDFDGDGKMDQFGLVWNFTEPYFFVPFLGGFGGWVMDDQYHPTLNSKAAAHAFQFVIDMRDKYKITPANCDYEMANTLFKDGLAGMIINGDWSWATYRDAGIDIGVTRIPKITQTDLWPTPMVSPKGYSVNANISDEKLTAAMHLLKFLLLPENQRKLAASINMMPTAISLRDDPAITGSELMRNSLSQIEVGRPMPVVPELRAVWDAMRPFYQAVLGGAMGAEEAAEQMQLTAEKKIREMNSQLQPAPYVVVFKIVVWALIIGFLLWQWKTILAFFRDFRKRPFVYWMMLPAFFIIVLTVLYPLIYNIILSASNMASLGLYTCCIVWLNII
ncbi:extracellular solute-binding protein [bacterium]|nr:extracellular solute-binding protein [bacterium]